MDPANVSFADSLRAAPPPTRPLLTQVLTAADRLRLAWLRGLGPVARTLVRNRELRVAVAGSALIAIAFTLTLFAPFWMLALGPVVWGVPHVMADLRYLVIRPGHHRRIGLAAAVGIPLAIASFGGGVLAGFGAAAGALLLGRGPMWRRISGLLVVATLFAAALAVGTTADLVFAHAHNFIAVLLWWLWRPRRSRLHWIPLALFALATAALLFGVADALLLSAGLIGWAPGGLDVIYHLRGLAPGIEGPLALRLVLLFAFAQAVHYSVWLRLVPEDDRERETPRTFAASYRALRADMGTALLAVVAIAAAAVGLWALVDLAQAREGYLRMAVAHGHLELAAAALLWLEGKRAVGSAGRVDAPARAQTGKPAALLAPGRDAEM